MTRSINLTCVECGASRDDPRSTNLALSGNKNDYVPRRYKRFQTDTTSVPGPAGGGAEPQENPSPPLVIKPEISTLDTDDWKRYVPRAESSPAADPEIEYVRALSEFTSVLDDGEDEPAGKWPDKATSTLSGAIDPRGVMSSVDSIKTEVDATFDPTGKVSYSTPGLKSEDGRKFAQKAHLGQAVSMPEVTQPSSGEESPEHLVTEEYTGSFVTKFDRDSVLRELLTVPVVDIAYDMTNDFSWLGRFQRGCEAFSKCSWDWWPLSPPVSLLEEKQRRVSWRCVSRLAISSSLNCSRSSSIVEPDGNLS